MIAILIGLDGREAERLTLDREKMHAPSWIIHDGKRWGFGASKIAGECFYYQVEMPLTNPMPLPPNLADDQSVMTIKRKLGRWDV